MADEQLHDELCRILDEREAARRRPDLRTLFSPAFLVQGGIAVIAATISATVAVTLQYGSITSDIEQNTKNNQQVVEMVGRERTERIAQDHQLGARIDIERETRQGQIRDSEDRIIKQLDQLNAGQTELNRDVKTILRALPRGSAE